MRLIVLTPVSARLFEWGLYAEVRRCWTPQLLSSSLIVVEVNSGPPSVEGVPQDVGQSLGAVGGWGDDGPAGVPINQHQVCCSFVMEEVSTNVLEGILRLFWHCWWHCCL